MTAEVFLVFLTAEHSARNLILRSDPIPHPGVAGRSALSACNHGRAPRGLTPVLIHQSWLSAPNRSAVAASFTRCSPRMRHR